MANERTVRVVQYGLGPIGIECVKTVLAKSGCGVELVGAIDIDPDKAGRDVAVVSGLEAPIGIEVSSDARALLSPFDRRPELSARLDELARGGCVSVLGTGVNPCFVMDTLALIASGVCTSVRRIEAERVVDAGQRRLPLQRKVGAGLTAEEFAERKRAGTIGHIGLLESMLLVAAGMDWHLDRVEENLDPVMATETVSTPHLQVQPGEVAGIHHTVEGYRGSEQILALDLKMYVGALNPHDAVRVDGNPPIDLEIRGGVFGDTATVGALINAIPLVRAAPAGLHTMKDLPVPRAFATI
jgi:4-hydroxy-tetrahydrodipicolinate reductase